MHVSTKDAFLRISPSGIEGERQWFRGNKDVYAKWSFDGTLVVENSYTGMVPCFWYSDTDQIIVSTSIFEILRYVRPEFDEAALAVFYRIGFFVGNKTPFAGISMLGPAETLVWFNGHLEIKGGIRDEAEFQGTYNEALHIYVELFRASIESICSDLPPNFAVLLTGGRDSRHISLELNRLGLRPRQVVTSHLMPLAPDVDWKIASKLCKHFGWPHRITEIPDDWYSADVWQINASHLMSYEHGWLQVVYATLREERIDFFFDGVGGDVLSAGTYQDPDTPEKILKKWKWNGIGELAKRDFLDIGSDEWAADLIGEHLGSGKSFHYWNRTRRSAALIPFRLADQSGGLAPFANESLVRFLLSLPLSMTADCQFHDNAIALAHPDVPVPYADYEEPLRPMPILHPRRYAFKLLRAERRYRKQYLRGLIRGYRSYAGYNPRVLLYMNKIEEIRQNGI